MAKRAWPKICPHVPIMDLVLDIFVGDYRVTEHPGMVKKSPTSFSKCLRPGKNGYGLIPVTYKFCSF